MPVSVFEYTDYRKYLHDFYLDKKKQTPSFSYRYFARKAETSSVGFYKDVVEGRKNLGRSFILRFSKALNHKEREAAYFENMVMFSEAKTRDERQYFFGQMMLCSESKVAKVEAPRYEYYSRWYYSAVRALLSYKDYKDCNEDHKKIANDVDPSIRPDQAKKACSILQKLNLVKKDNKGYMRLSDPLISTGKVVDPAVNTIHIENFQKTMIEHSLTAFSKKSFSNMDLSTLTLSISEDTFDSIKKDLAAFRRNTLGMAEIDESADRVYQLNIQFFPISKIREEQS